jgi:hypothetical protein
MQEELNSNKRKSEPKGIIHKSRIEELEGKIDDKNEQLGKMLK